MYSDYENSFWTPLTRRYFCDVKYSIPQIPETDEYSRLLKFEVESTFDLEYIPQIRSYRSALINFLKTRYCFLNNIAVRFELST